MLRVRKTSEKRTLLTKLRHLKTEYLQIVTCLERIKLKNLRIILLYQFPLKLNHSPKRFSLEKEGLSSLNRNIAVLIPD